MIISVLPGGTPGLSDSQARNNQTVEEYQRIMAAVLQEVHPSKLTASYAQRLAVAINKFERDVSALKSKDDSRADDNVSSAACRPMQPKHTIPCMCLGSRLHPQPSVEDFRLTIAFSHQAGSSSWNRSRAWHRSSTTTSSSRT